jgi:hypothetical protein
VEHTVGVMGAHSRGFHLHGAKEADMARPVVTYERGSTYVSHVSGGKTCCGLVGTLTVTGMAFDTIERFDKTSVPDFVHLPARDFPRAVMYWHPAKKRIIHPWAGEGPSQKQENIFVHRGSKPAHFEGCIGVGFLTRAGNAFELQRDELALEIIWEAVGGRPDNKDGWDKHAPRLVFRVTAPFPDRTKLTPLTP